MLKCNLYLDRSNLPLYVFVIAVFDMPRTVIAILDLPVRYYLGGNPPWLILFLLLMLFLNIFLVAKVFKKVVPFDMVDLLMLITLVTWLLLYVYHADYAGGVWKSWNAAYLITTNLWLFIALYILKSYSYFYELTERITTVTINTLTLFALFFLIIAAFDYLFCLSIHDNLQESNGFAMKSAFCILLLLFFDNKKKSYWGFSIFFIHCALIMYAVAKASIIIVILLVSYKIYSFLFPRGVRTFCCLFLVLSMIVIVPLYWSKGLKFFGDFFMPFDIYGVAYKPIESYSISNSLVSAISRVQSIILLINEFIENPLIGIGYQKSMNVKSFGYICHAYYLFPLASYGIIGVLPYLIMISTLLVNGLKKNRESTIATAIFVVTAFTFLNDMVAWLAIAVFLTQSPSLCYNQLPSSYHKFRVWLFRSSSLPQKNPAT